MQNRIGAKRGFSIAMVIWSGVGGVHAAFSTESRMRVFDESRLVENPGTLRVPARQDRRADNFVVPPAASSVDRGQGQFRNLRKHLQICGSPGLLRCAVHTILYLRGMDEVLRR